MYGYRPEMTEKPSDIAQLTRIKIFYKLPQKYQKQAVLTQCIHVLTGQNTGIFT
mgnify:CR=1 FL=1